jgi:DNA polymerase-3 subunit delta
MVAAEKKPQKPVYLLYGEDTYSSTQKLKFWQDEFIKKYGGETNVEIFEGKTMDLVEFDTNIESMPFLAEKKLVIIKNFMEKARAEEKKPASDTETENQKLKSKTKADNQKRMSEIIERTPDFSLIIFHQTEMPDRRTSLFQKISKIGTAKEFPLQLPQEIAKWITDKAKEKGIKISYSTALYLSTYCSLNFWLIANELEKLGTYANGKEITKEMIDDLVSATLSASIFKLTDAIATKNRQESLKTFRIMTDSGEEINMIFFMIVRHFRLLIQIKEMLGKNESPNAITSKLKQHPFVIQNLSKQAKHHSPEKIEQIYSTLLQIDTDIKTGVIKAYGANTSEFELAIERLIIDCCK